MEGFRVEASHDGLALSDEEDPREYTPFSPARDGWALGDGQIRGVARFEDFPYTRARPRAGVLDLLLSTLGSGRPRFEFSARGGGRFEITRLDDAFRVHKTVSLPEGARPRAYLHVLAPAGTLTIHLDGVAVARPTSTEGERTPVSESADITVVSLVTGRGVAGGATSRRACVPEFSRLSDRARRRFRTCRKPGVVHPHRHPASKDKGMIRALLGATLYYLLPLFVGYGVLAGRGGSFPTAWASGSFALLALVGFANLGFGGSAPELRHGFLALSVAILAAMGVREILRRFQDRKRWPMELTLAVTAVVGVALLAQCVLRSDSPYPSFVNWDGLQHLTLAREMNRGEFSLDLTRYSDTFQLATYVPVYHAPLFLAWAASGATPEGLYWFLDLLHGFMAALVTCRLGWSIRKRPLDALLAGSLGALTLESQIAMTGFSHMPQNLAGMYFALCAADFLDRKVPPRELGIQLLYLGAAHFFVGGFGVALLVALHVLQTFERREGLMLGLKVGGVLIVALSVLLAGYNSEFRLDPFSIGDSAAFNLDADQKNDLFRHWYGYGYYVYGVLLAVLAWRTHEVRLRVLCVVSGLLVPAILFPFPYTFKLFALAHFVLAPWWRRRSAARSFRGGSAWSRR
jgi:hypothetical protein